MRKLRQIGWITIIFSSVLFTGVRGNAAGGIYLGGNAFYDSREVSATTSTATGTTKAEKTYLSGQLGFITGSGIYIGALYENDTIDTGGSTKPTMTYLAGTLGYIFQNDCFINVSYVPRAEYSQYLTTNDKWTLGSGFQVDVGLLHDLADNFYIGVQITHRRIEFKNYNNGTTDDASMSLKITDTFPMAKLAFIF